MVTTTLANSRIDPMIMMGITAAANIAARPAML
jgi:hypothetical protein